jgi:hypothetical protein
MLKTSMDLTRLLRYNSLASACGRLLATACLAVGAGLFINESTPKEAVAKEVKPLTIKEYIQSQLTVNTYQCLDTLATKESNWNFKAKNGSHHGFMQGRSKWLATANEEQQYDWASRYVAHRYGVTEYDESDFCAALDHWKKHSWH